ncbi:DUF1176 domain-containing protein [Devosia chinhatensis]|uniref:DUF1176 domain-containing protein n=1 Tax=Devosia chinhatensis TaxID=429727 RepID=UPI000696C22E|nr:DUF1176 domain-containing protein [Devosia chinhatensis]
MIRPLLWLPLAALSFTSASAQEPSLEEQARALHALAGGTYCEPFEGGYVPDDDYLQWTITYQPSWSEDAEEEEVILIRLFCGAGAYNIQHAYYIHREYEGLTPLAFATPSIDAVYDGEDGIDGELESVTTAGMSTSLILVNSDYDPETQTITSFSKWRGIGDASSSGTWAFKEGEFVLIRYDVDASYDGEINPETIIDYGQN